MLFQVSNPLLLIFYYPPLHWHLSSEPSVSCCPSGLPSNHHNTIVCSIYSLVSASLFFPSGSSREEVPKLCQRYSNLSLWDHSLEPPFKLKLFLGVVLESFQPLGASHLLLGQDTNCRSLIYCLVVWHFGHQSVSQGFCSFRRVLPLGWTTGGYLGD